MTTMKFSIKIARKPLIILILTHSAFSQERQLTLEDLQGSWYNSGFIDVLQKTKSVHQAVYGVYFVAFEIAKDQQAGSYKWTSIFNFHEGVTRQLTGISVVDNSTFSLECTDCHDENTHFKLLSKDTLRFSDGKEFKRIQNFTSFVNELTVSAVYVDDQGQIYFFYKNGLSLWPNNKFHYEVGLEQVEFPADYFHIISRKDGAGHPLYYFFKATAPGLEIYKRVSESSEILMDKTPFLKLSRYEKEFYSYLDDARFKRLEVQSQEQLRLLRNEIFARHRHSFDSPELRSYFANQPWYHEYKDHKVSMDELSWVELKVLKEIQNLERITK